MTEPDTISLIVSLHVAGRDSNAPAMAAMLQAASNRLAKLHRLANHAHQLVKAQHRVEHRADGFTPRKRAIDTVLAEFESELLK